MPKTGTILDLKKAVVEVLGGGEGGLEVEELFVAEFYSSKLYKEFCDDDSLSPIRKEDKIYVYQIKKQEREEGEEEEEEETGLLIFCLIFFFFIYFSPPAPVTNSTSSHYSMYGSSYSCYGGSYSYSSYSHHQKRLVKKTVRERVCV